MDRTYHVIIPKPGTPLEFTVREGSGMIASDSPLQEGRAKVDYEGNLYDAINLRDPLDRIRCAAGRQVQGYPTIARSSAKWEELVIVGTLDPETYEIKIDPQPGDLEVMQRWFKGELNPGVYPREHVYRSSDLAALARRGGGRA